MRDFGIQAGYVITTLPRVVRKDPQLNVVTQKLILVTLLHLCRPLMIHMAAFIGKYQATLDSRKVGMKRHKIL